MLNELGQTKPLSFTLYRKTPTHIQTTPQGVQGHESLADWQRDASPAETGQSRVAQGRDAHSQSHEEGCAPLHSEFEKSPLKVSPAMPSLAGAGPAWRERCAHHAQQHGGSAGTPTSCLGLHVKANEQRFTRDVDASAHC